MGGLPASLPGEELESPPETVQVTASGLADGKRTITCLAPEVPASVVSSINNDSDKNTE
jgi:hypothetical protein